MRNTGMSVWMARTVPVFSAVLKIAEQELGDTGGYISVLPRWTPMRGSSSPLLSACSIWFIGSPTFTCEEVWVLLTWVLLTKSHEEKMSFLSLLTWSPVYHTLNLFLCSNLVNCLHVILFTPNSPIVSVIWSIMFATSQNLQGKVKLEQENWNKTSFSFSYNCNHESHYYLQWWYPSLIQNTTRCKRPKSVPSALGSSCGQFDPQRISP